MPQNELSILILKPTKNFIALISAQFPDFYDSDSSLPCLNNMAYSIPKCHDDESVLNVLENFYPLIFQHELNRLVGNKVSERIDATFFDFLCCFKFELYSDVVMMDTTKDNAERVLCVEPRSVSLFCSPQASQVTREKLSLKPSLNHYTTAWVKSFRDETEIDLFLKHHYRPILQEEMKRFSNDAAYLPVVNSFKLFTRYFDVKWHAPLVRLH